MYSKREIKQYLKDYLLCSNDFITYLGKPNIDLIDSLQQDYAESDGEETLNIIRLEYATYCKANGLTPGEDYRAGER